MPPIRMRHIIIIVALVTAILSLSLVQAQSGLIFDISRQGTTSTYNAVSRTGSFNYTGTLKTVVESAVSQVNAAGGGSILFAAGDFNLGTTYFQLSNIHDIIFAGQGIDLTIIRNFTSAAADTEPFNCYNCDRLTIRDMTVSAGGSVRSTSDTLDFDYGDNNLIERVKITSSRARAIVFDGKDAGSTADGNTIRNCVITGRIPTDGIQFLASNRNRVEGCVITGVTRNGIYAVKSSSTAPQPNKPSNDNIILNNQVTNSGAYGLAINGSSRNTISGNTLNNNAFSGIHLTTSSSIFCDSNLINLNTATGNEQYGLRIASADCRYTQVGSNNFTGNTLGAIRDSGTGTIYNQSPTATYTPSRTPITTPTRTPTPSPTMPPPQSLVLTAVRDSYVNASSTSTNYGTSTSLRTDSSPINRSYIAFDVPSYTGTVTSAYLRVYASSSNPIGYRVYRSTSNWTETGITYSNAPGISTLLGSSGAISSNTWTQVNVTSRITGAGSYTFVLDSTSSTATSYSSRTGSHPPQLVINFSSGQ